MGALIRAGGLKGFAAVVESLGGDPAAMYRRFQLPVRAEDQPELLVSAVNVNRMLEAAAAEFHCPDLALRMVEHQDLSVLGPLSVAIANAATAGEALESGSKFLFVHSPTMTLSVGPDPWGKPDIVAVTFSSNVPYLPDSPQTIDCGLAFCHQTSRLMLGSDYRLETVLLSHPPLAPGQRYRDFFGAEVRFDQPVAALRFPGTLLDKELHGDPTIRNLAHDYLTRNFPSPTQAVTPRVHAVLVQGLGAGEVRIETAAKALLVHPRTLQRYLADEGTSFEHVLDGARREVAQHLLTTTELPMANVAAMIGLSEQSALSRAARRWFGCTPTQVRRRGRIASAS